MISFYIKVQGEIIFWDLNKQRSRTNDHNFDKRRGATKPIVCSQSGIHFSNENKKMDRPRVSLQTESLELNKDIAMKYNYTLKPIVTFVCFKRSLETTLTIHLNKCTYRPRWKTISVYKCKKFRNKKEKSRHQTASLLGPLTINTITLII